MNVKRLATIAMLALCILMAASGCGVRLVAKADPTLPPTRTPRPTFTPRPQETDTPQATDTPQVTDTPQPTDTKAAPTAKPTVKATAKPVVKATNPPPPPAQPTTPPQPTKSPYMYSYVSQKCEHSGGTYIKVTVFSDYHDPNSQQAGVKVRLSWDKDGPSIADVLTDAYGTATFVLAADGQPAKKGTYFAWTINGQGARTSDMSAPVVINGLGEDAPNTCWMANVFFAAGKD